MVSVIICTHNPRTHYLRRVLDALKGQTLPQHEWELLLVDNASSERLADTWDLSWHPHARHTRENAVGLTPARLRGIGEATGELLVFVDDDNILSCAYLENALILRSRFPQIGAFGPGRISAEFETQPDPEVVPYLNMLTLRNLAGDKWSNVWENNVSTNMSVPFGAGMCILRSVAVSYARAVKTTPLRQLLGRHQKSLMSCEDVDMAIFACNSGFGMGNFCDLSLTHLIPSRRVTVGYILEVAEGHSMSHTILAKVWEYWRKESPLVEYLRHLRALASMRGMARRVYLAQSRGRRRGCRLLNQLSANT